MDEKAALLEQLRIDRPPPGPVRTSGGARRALIALGVAIVVLAAAAATWYRQVARGEAIPVHAASAQAVQSNAAGAPVAGSLLDASGYVVALREATVSAKSIYKVDEVLVQEGDQVRQDQVIARLDDTNTRAALEQAQAQVSQLQAALAAAKLAAADAQPTYQRDRAQLAEGLISQDAFDATKASYDAAQSAVAVAEQNLAVARASVVVAQRYEDDTVIRAPFAGMVTVKNAQPGEIVSPQFSGGGGIAQIVDMDSLEVDVDVSENFISRVHPKQPATITLDAYPDWHIPAEVIAIIPTADRSKATVQVRVGFKQRDARVLPEMGARVSFLEQAPVGDSPSGTAAATATTATPTVMVPPEAVQAGADPSAGSGAVFVLDGNTVSRRVVRLGVRTADGQAILSGLDPGERVAIGDFSKLHDGARVRVTQ
ncbi:MAG TPA: efflux RND transporter periplasmic adaptor subunit [Steroidobacteraceae bacterium]|jgi:RND family efflux transporter MFP subunit|nr:efflux RND transporter periplasmic adaptor subunit [Steroidobacteraceae bacterium]